MENMRQKIAEIITHTHKTPLEQADEILLLFGFIKSVCERCLKEKELKVCNECYCSSMFE